VVLFQDAHVLDVSREDMAVITVSQSLNTLGIIESANAVALSMFGYNKRDMVGKNISLIVPPPMNARHDAYLKAFLDSGRSVVSGPAWLRGIQHGYCVQLVCSVRRAALKGAQGEQHLWSPCLLVDHGGLSLCHVEPNRRL
jgi:PAS domain S-box-containing protein